MAAGVLGAAVLSVVTDDRGASAAHVTSGTGYCTDANSTWGWSQSRTEQPMWSMFARTSLQFGASDLNFPKACRTQGALCTLVDLQQAVGTLEELISDKLWAHSSTWSRPSRTHTHRTDLGQAVGLVHQ